MSQQKLRHLFSGIFSSLRNVFTPTTPSHSNSTSIGATSNNVHDKSLKLENIIVGEYNFASNYSLQVLHDRRETFNLYILLIGISASAFALISSNGNAHLNLKMISTIVLLIFAVINLFFFIRFVNLGRVYQDSITRMKMIRDYYIEQFHNQIPDISNIIHSGMEFNSPDSLRPTNLNVCCVYASIEIICLIVAAFVSDDLWPRFNYGILLYARPYILGFTAIFVVLFTHILYYRYVFRPSISGTGHAETVPIL